MAVSGGSSRSAWLDFTIVGSCTLPFSSTRKLTVTNPTLPLREKLEGTSGATVRTGTGGSVFSSARAANAEKQKHVIKIKRARSCVDSGCIGGNIGSNVHLLEKFVGHR